MGSQVACIKYFNSEKTVFLVNIKKVYSFLFLEIVSRSPFTFSWNRKIPTNAMPHLQPNSTSFCLYTPMEIYIYSNEEINTAEAVH